MKKNSRITIIPPSKRPPLNPKECKTSPDHQPGNFNNHSTMTLFTTLTSIICHNLELRALLSSKIKSARTLI